MKAVALYARVSSDKQEKQATVDSQVAALIDRAKADGHTVLASDHYVDDGCSGSTLVRAALEKLRDRAAEGGLDLLYVHSPDRLARKYAYQVLLLEELSRGGVSVVFLNGPTSRTAEDELLLQVQGMIAEYERAKILERSRRGKLHKARSGVANVLSHAPYGYRYVRRTDTEPASYQVLLHEANVVRQVFRWYVEEHLSLNTMARRLTERGVPTRKGVARWPTSSLWAMLRNPAYMGRAAYGKTEGVAKSVRLRPVRGKSWVPRREKSTYRPRPASDHVPTERPDDELSKDEKDRLVAKGRRAALRTVDRRFTDGFVEHRRRNQRSEHTIAKNRTEMRAAMGLAKRAGIWTGDLDDLFPPGFESAYEPRRVFWTHQQATKVLAQLNDVPHRRAQVCFVLASGAEKRAVHKALRADLTQVPLPLHGTKTRDRERSTPVLFAWQRSLLSYAKTHADGEDGLAFTEWKNSRRDLAIACKAAGTPVVSMHGLRHVFGAWMLDEGLSEGIVAKALGHRDLRQLVLTYDTRDPGAIQRRAEEQMRRWKGQRGLRLIKGGKAGEAQSGASRSKRQARAPGRR